MSEADSVKRHLGSRIREIRKHQGLSQVALATRASRSQKTMRELEAGKANPRLDSLVEVAEALGVSLSHLFSTRSVATDSRMLNGSDLRQVEDAVGALWSVFGSRRPPRKRKR